MKHQGEETLPDLKSPPPLIWFTVIYLSAFVGWGVTAIVSIGMTTPPNMAGIGALLVLGFFVTLFLVIGSIDLEFDTTTGWVLVVSWSAILSSSVTIAAFNTLTDPFIDHAVLILVLGLLPALNIAGASAYCLYRWVRQYRPGWFSLELERSTDLQNPDLAS